jgi:hypothetical protein
MCCFASSQGVFDIEPCGTVYWLITVAQVPVAVAFTACIGQKRKSQAHGQVPQRQNRTIEA